MGAWLRMALVALAHNVRKPTTILGVARLEKFAVLASQSQEVMSLDHRTIKDSSPSVKA